LTKTSKLSKAPRAAKSATIPRSARRRAHSCALPRPASGRKHSWTIPRLTRRRKHSWAVYWVSRNATQFLGIVYDRSDEQAAIAQAITEFHVVATQGDRLVAGRCD
jgi:hypothetical protein